MRATAYIYGCVRVRGAYPTKKRGSRRWLLAQRARGAPVQKVHCIYKSFIMNYTMVYLKWEACLVRGYMGYRDYNACGGERRTEGGRGRRGPRLQEASDPRATGRYRVGVLSRAHALPDCELTRIHTHPIHDRTSTRAYKLI